MPPPTVRSKSHSGTAVEQLRELIFSGELSAGSDHLESELAVRLGMSRTPVREALLTIEAQGLVEVRPRKGVRILPLSPDDMREIYDVLTELEGLAAFDAANFGHSEANLKVLTASIDAMDTALQAEDRKRWAAADDAFHTELVRLGGNSRNISLVALLADQVRRARGITLHIRPRPTQSNEDHRGVLEAIRNGDATAARRIHTAHRKAAKSVMLSLLEQHHLNRL